MTKTTSTSNKASYTTSITLFDKIEEWAGKKDKQLLAVFVFLSFLFSVMLFNARISEAHDDALYLEGGWRYVNEFPNFFYTQNAPLYVLFLGLLTKLFGFKLLLFKLFNVVFNALAVYFFYKAFSKRIPYLVLLPVMLFISSNHLIQYFASMTFTESFYLFLQSVFFYVFFKLYDALQKNEDGTKHIKLWLLVGLFAFLIATCKSVAIVAVPALIFYFILYKQFKNAGLALLSFLVFKIPYEIIVKLVWGNQNQFSGQSKILLLKDPYDKAAGNDDFSGFVSRLLDNSNLYLSKRFFQILGLRDENSTEVYGLLSIIVIAVVAIAFFHLYKQKNKPLVFFTIFTVGQLLLSFIILQARWDQPRIVLICMPIMLIVMYYLFFNTVKKSDIGRMIYTVLIVVISVSVLMSTIKRGNKNIPIVKKNMKGDIYYGYTPDWQNFLKCSKWCADSLPQTTFVASRKAPMSFVYSNGKKFFPIYSVIKKDSLTNQSNPDSAIAYFEKNGVTHLMLASLRIDPTQNTGDIINTLHNIAQPILQKYPNKLKLVHTEGYTEETYLFEIVK